MLPHDHKNHGAPGLDDADRIGIMADSHGEAALIDAAAACFRRRGCGLQFHLGDICDTARPASAQACLEKMAVHRIAAIRGNNEHTLLLNRPAGIDTSVMETIRAMPLTRRVGPALLAHSLPFVTTMGPRCMIEDMTPGHIRRFFQLHPGGALFRGHSHRPEIVRRRSGALVREKMLPGRSYPLYAGESAVITCGALAGRLCLIWDRHRETVELIGLGKP